MGEEDFSCGVDGVEEGFVLFIRGVVVEAETDEVVVLGDEFEAGVPHYFRRECFSAFDVVADVVLEAIEAEGAENEPEF